jgi:amino acid transporter
VVLASVVVALAVYQVVLMAVGYGKLKLPFLSAKAASFTHRSVGDAIVFVTLLVAFMCIGFFEIADGIEHADDGERTRVAVHVVAAFLLLGVLALKILVVRRGRKSGRYLPLLGLTVFGLFLVTWVTSAGDYLWGG